MFNMTTDNTTSDVDAFIKALLDSDKAAKDLDEALQFSTGRRTQKYVR